MKRAKVKQMKPPSRERYEKANPTVSARVPVETRNRLLEVLPRLGMSLPDAFKVLAGELEAKAIPIDAARREGYEEDRKLYAVKYKCYICGKPILITDPETKEFIGRFLTKHG